MTGGSPETAYVLLKHIMVLAQRAPGVFEDEYVSFFVRFSDPIQVCQSMTQSILLRGGRMCGPDVGLDRWMDG